MAILAIDLSGMTEVELQELITQASEAIELARQNEANTAQARKNAIANSVATLTALLGSGSGNANMESIRGLLRYSDAQIGANAAIAIRLILQGMEILASTTRNIALSV